MQRAFTLVELIVVVIIITILVSIAYPNFVTAVERARVSEAIVVLHTLVGAQKRYYEDNSPHIYTDDLDDLDTTVDSLKYFDNPVPTTYVNTLIFMVRNGYMYPDFAGLAGPYTLYIGTSGIISCNNPAGSDICNKIGY